VTPPRFLLDTNVVSEPLRPQPAAALLARLKRHGAHAALPAVVWHELVYGWTRLAPGRRRDAIGHYLSQVVAPSFPVLDYGRDAADWHARERARLEAAGRAPSYADGQVAAIARVHGLVLVTRNVRDFAGFEGLEVQDWSVP
jgi:tRNA(fMet)-specific endonuclease VapC